MGQYTSMAGIEIIAVEGGPQLKNFIDLPWRIYAEYPNWIPPLRTRFAGCWTESTADPGEVER